MWFNTWFVFGDAESARNDTLLFEFVRELLQLSAQTPAFTPLFQFAPAITHIKTPPLTALAALPRRLAPPFPSPFAALP